MKRTSISLIILCLLSFFVIDASAIERKAAPLNCVTGEELVRNGETDIMRALRGRIAGLNISARKTSNISASSSFTSSMRGTSSLVGNNEPLYVVDGMQVESLDFVNIYDVALIQVLKSNEAFSIYGSRAANGAIVVTTKKQ